MHSLTVDAVAHRQFDQSSLMSSCTLTGGSVVAATVDVSVEYSLDSWISCLVNQTLHVYTIWELICVSLSSGWLNFQMVEKANNGLLGK